MVWSHFLWYGSLFWIKSKFFDGSECLFDRQTFHLFCFVFSDDKMQRINFLSVSALPTYTTHVQFHLAANRTKSKISFFWSGSHKGIRNAFASQSEVEKFEESMSTAKIKSYNVNGNNNIRSAVKFNWTCHVTNEYCRHK